MLAGITRITQSWQPAVAGLPQYVISRGSRGLAVRRRGGTGPAPFSAAARLPIIRLMTQDQDAVHRSGLRLRVSHRASVWHFLVAIAVAPTLALSVLSGQLVLERLRDASVANRVERDLTTIGSLDRLRMAINNEQSAGSLAVLGRQLGVPAVWFAAQLGLSGLSVAESRAGTDAVLASVPRLPAVTPRLAGIRDTLHRLRTSMDAAIAAGAKGLPDLPTLQLSYLQATTVVSDIELEVVHRVVAGDEGVVSTRLLSFAQSLEQICALVTVGGERGGLFFIAMLSSPSARATLVGQLQNRSRVYRVRADDLGSRLTPGLARVWADLQADPAVRQFDQVTSGGSDSPLATSLLSGRRLDPAAVLAFMPLAVTGTRVLVRFSDFLAHAVSVTIGQARADAGGARQTVLFSTLATLAVLSVTLTALLVIGGLLRSRLQRLAGGARRLSAGHLEPVSVQGPRELAAASEAINDAVASLRHVELKAELLASGDLDSPELERPAPGPLGAAVHASVARIVTAVREREELRQELAHQASHDPLTGLPNRAELDRALLAALGRAVRAGSAVSVLFVDLDRFKACNDLLGHAAGDHVLREVAERLRATVRAGDLVGRMGGDEFVVVVETVQTGPELVELGERLVAELSRPIEYQGQPIEVSASIGLSTSEAGRVGADQLLSEADTAAYQAKAAGGGELVSYDRALRERMETRRELRTAVGEALRQHDLRLRYQPVVELPAGRLRGFEALLRWQRPGVGLVLPGAFLPELEGSELAAQVDRWVLDEATRQLAEWSEDPALADLEISVNLTGWHLLQSGVVDDVRAALQQSGLAPQRLSVEIAETAALDGVRAVEHLHALAELGVRLALDDFGTGRLSVSQLLRLPVGTLKLDPSLTAAQPHPAPARPAGRDSGSRSLWQSVIELAHSLGLLVVAEGVESPGQLAALAAGACDRAQGYLISHPLPAVQARVWALSRPPDAGFDPALPRTGIAGGPQAGQD